MSDQKTRKQYRIDARKYRELLKEIGIVALHIDTKFCVCNNAYIDRGMVDPNCQAHDISEYIFDFIAEEKS